MASRFRPDGTQILWHVGEGKIVSTGQRCLIKTWLDEQYELHAIFSLLGPGGPWEEADLEELEADASCEDNLTEDAHIEHILRNQRTT